MGAIMDRFRAKRNAKVQSKQAKYEAQTAAAQQATSAIHSGADASQVLGNLKSVGLNLTSTPGEKLAGFFGGLVGKVGEIASNVVAPGASSLIKGVTGIVGGGTTATPTNMIAPVAPIQGVTPSADGGMSSMLKQYGIFIAVGVLVVVLLILKRK